MIRNRIRQPAAANFAIDRSAREQTPRQRTRRFGRFVYLILVLSFIIYLIVTVTGHLFILNGSGLVSSDRFVVGAAYTSRVIETQVAPGSAVQEGDVIARLESTEVLTALAQLAQNTALIEERRQEILKRQNIVQSLLPIAQRRLDTAQQGVDRLDLDPTGGLTSQAYRSSVMAEAFAAERDLVTLSTEAQSSIEELASIEASLAEIDTAMSNTRNAYADGVVRAPHDGTVSANVAVSGQVLTVGEPVLEILNGEAFILAYLPNGRLYEVLPGHRVIITDGVRVVEGVVERVDVVADNLPSEFRTAFGIQERQQIMRVVPTEPMPFPYLSRVTVASPWSLSHLWARAMSLLAGNFNGS